MRWRCENYENGIKQKSSYHKAHNIIFFIQQFELKCLSLLNHTVFSYNILSSLMGTNLLCTKKNVVSRNTKNVLNEKKKNTYELFYKQFIVGNTSEDLSTMEIAHRRFYQ